MREATRELPCRRPRSPFVGRIPARQRNPLITNQALTPKLLWKAIRSGSLVCLVVKDVAESGTVLDSLLGLGNFRELLETKEPTVLKQES